MNGRPSLVLLCALLALGGPLAARAGDTPPRPLRFNPFARPDPSAITPAAARLVLADGWAPVLSAALADGEASLANLGGVILAIGEETHGYRLVAVDTFEASFEKDGATLVLPVAPRDPLGRP